MLSPKLKSIQERRSRAAQKQKGPATPQVPALPDPKVEEASISRPADPPEVETVDYSSMTKSQLQDLLKERGVAYLPRSTNRILIGLLENV